MNRDEYLQRQEEMKSVFDEASAVLQEWAPMLDVVRVASASYFKGRTQGKCYKRDPAFKIKLPFQNDMSLIIHSRGRATRQNGVRTVTVPCDHINLLMHQLGKGALDVLLRAGEPPAIRSYRIATAIDDARLFIDLVLEFIKDPNRIIVSSGDRCVYCQKDLTVDNSRARGIGPECFKHHGDFVDYLRIGLEALDVFPVG